MIYAANLQELDWLSHGFGLRDSILPASLTTIRQIHSNIVVDAENADAENPLPEGDALVSNRPGVTVAVKTADCVPILLADPVTRAVAAIHAGWRGTAAQIVPAAIRDMAKRWGVRPEHLRAAIGPAIGGCCYEVSAEVARQFAPWAAGLNDVDLPVRVDLSSVNEVQLRQSGVTDVWKSGECTFCRAERFYSFRREREQAGRMLSFVGLKSF
jgi:YfiH family protein